MLYQLAKRVRGTNLLDLPEYEHLFNEHDEGTLTVGLREALTQEELDLLQQDLEGKIVLTQPIYQYLDPPELVIPFRKEIAPLAIAAMAIATLAIGGVIYWKLTGLEVKPRPTWAAAGVTLTGLGAGAALYGYQKSKPLVTIPGLAATGGGLFLAIREFIPRKPPPGETEYSIDGDEARYSGPVMLGEALTARFLFRHIGPETDPWVGIALAVTRHKELGQWPLVGGRASELGITIVRDDEWKDYWTPDFEVPATEEMRGKTFDVLKIVARDPVAEDLSNLTVVRIDDDWDNGALEVMGEKRFEIIADRYGTEEEWGDWVKT